VEGLLSRRGAFLLGRLAPALAACGALGLARPAVRDDMLARAPDDFEPAVNGLTARVTTEELIGLNRRVGVDRRDPREVAAAWLRARGLAG
jgi:hypothetical protein